MTDTTYIAALREQWSIIHERKDLDVFITTVFTALEEERQRADYLQQVIDQRNGECDRLINEIAALEAIIAAGFTVKGE